MIDREYVNRLVRATPVEYYVSGHDGARAWWPWRMMKAHSVELRPAHVEKSGTFALDSNFKDDSVTNRDVLDQAATLGADIAVLADVYQEMEPTVGALLDGLELAGEHHFDGRLMLPLQAPHVECYEQVAPSAPNDVLWAIGGLKDENAMVKIDAAKRLRDVAPNAHIHGLGYGVTEELARSVRQNPSLLDSVDSSTSLSNGIGGQPGRDEKTTIVAARATAERLERLRWLTPFAEERPAAEKRGDSQAGMEEWV